MEETTLLNITDNFNPFSGPAIERVIYTTQSQAEIWIACSMGGDDANRAYNESVSLILKGQLNKNALENAIQILGKRHEALRSTFSTDGRFMTIFEEISITPFYQDLSQLSEIDKQHTVSNYLWADANYTFNLVKGPLLKFGLLKLSEQEHHLVITAHHIICDGWSMGIVLEELGAFYSAFVQGEKPEVPKNETFSSYADDEITFLKSEDYLKTLNYWLNQYQSFVPEVSIPTDFPRPSLRTFKSNRLDFAIDNSLVSELKKVGIKSGTSFVTTIMTAFEVFLYFQTGQDELVLGLPAAGQSVTGKTQLVGHCVNLLPLKSKVNPGIPFNEYLKNRKVEIFDDFDHQQFSFGQLIQKLNISRDPSRVPLVPIVFNIDMGMAKAVSFEGLSFKLKSNPRAFETFEIFLNATGTEDELILEWSFNTALFKPSTIEKMMASFKEVMHSIVENPSIKIGEILKVDDSAYVQLNDTVSSYPQQPLHELLAKQAEKTPLNIALKFGEKEINYKNLITQTHQLAHRLKENGIGESNFIAVLLPRSIELVTTLVAVLECGASYLPLDPNFPNKRLEFMLEDSKANFLITTKQFSTTLESTANILYIEELFSDLSQYPHTPLNENISNEKLAYLLYTSGSTGKPKGVSVTHKNLVNFLYSMIKAPGIETTDRLLCITTISFDIVGLELFIPLLVGATLVIANEETAKDGRLLLDCIENESISIIQATPTTWQMLIDSGWVNKLPIKALCGGEQLPMGLAKKLLAKVNELWNMYGPTETTIWSTTKQILVDDQLITIGKPIANTQVYILNEQGILLEPGQIGEIVIGGDGVAQGYLNRDDLTAQKFIVNPYYSNLNGKMYRTGDLGRLLPSGEIECLGRMDDQVKIRGHRIELGEIEEAINSIEEIVSSVVLLDGERLRAFALIHDQENISQSLETNWKDHLKELLPAHMVPYEIIPLTEFPTTLNGKIDRKALINASSKQSSQDLNEPITESEQIIATIWQECLAINKIDINSDFFELGGHSLLAVKVMSQIENKTESRLPLASLLAHSTIKKLAAYLDKNLIKWNSLVPLKSKGSKVPLFIVHGADHNILIFKNLAENLDKDQPVYALQAKGLSGDIEPLDTVEDMAAHYISEIISVHPDGPYNLGGFSFGGIVAFEMAKQLNQQGQKVNILALFDCYVYPHYYYSNTLVKKTISTLYNLGQLFYMGFDMFSSVKNFKRRKELLKLKIAGLALRLKYGREQQFKQQFNRSPKIDDMLELAFIRYNLIPQNVKVDLFRSTEDIYFAHDYNYLGWRKIALGGIRKHIMPGNHSELFHSPAVNECASILQNLLDKEND